MPKSLPASPSLKFLKNEAKTIRAARRREDPSGRLSLQGIQHDLAIEYGFKNWEDLRIHVASQPGVVTAEIDDEDGKLYCWRRFVLHDDGRDEIPPAETAA